MKEEIDERKVTAMILYLESAKYEHHQQCQECREYGFERGCEQGRALQETRTKWAVLNVRLGTGNIDNDNTIKEA